MESKKYCLLFKCAVMGICLMLLTGCSILAPKPELERPEASQHIPPKESPAPAAKAIEKPPVPKPLLPQNQRTEDPPVNNQSPMALAALNFSEQGQAYLKNRKPDEAIRALERAVNLNPKNGENYYYLAEAWLMKGNAVQAREFNRLAEMYVKAGPEWIQRIQSQKDRISNFK